MPRSRTARRVAALLGGCSVLAACVTDSAAPAPQSTAATTPATGDAHCSTTAAQRLDWGTPTRASDFADGLPPDWHPYGPEVGHDKKGVRTPEAITVRDGVATITGTADGTTGAWSLGIRGSGTGGGRPASGWTPVRTRCTGAATSGPSPRTSRPAERSTGWRCSTATARRSPSTSTTARRTAASAVRSSATPRSGQRGRSSGLRAHHHVRRRRGVVFDGPLGALPTEAHEHDGATRLVPARGWWTGDKRFGDAHGLAHQWALPESEPATLSLAPDDPEPASRGSTLTASPARSRRAPDSWAAGGKRIWGRHPPPTTRL